MNNGKIYKLVCNVTGDVYYGSTIKNLNDRLCNHKYDYKQYLKGKRNYYTSFKIIENGNYRMELVENYRCMNRKQLESIERVYIEGYKCVNKNVAGRTKKESDKLYYEKNKDKVNENKKKYREKNKEYFKEYNKEYYNENKNKILEYQKKYFQKNKQIIDLKRNVKLFCDCGGSYVKRNLKIHLRTKKHQVYLNQ